MLYFILVLQAIICAILSGILAKEKGHSPFDWFLTGLFFGVFGLIAAAGLPRKLVPKPTTELIKKCPDCAESIHKEASVCKYCGRKFSKEEILSDLIVSLQDNSIIKKSLALEALCIFKDPSTVPHVIKLVKTISIRNQMDPNIMLLNKAIHLLVKIGTPNISNELVAIFKETKSVFKANKVVEILGILHDPSVIPDLVYSLNKRELRDSVTKSLIKFGEIAIPHLEKILKEGKRSERKLAEQIIAKIQSTQFK